VHTRERVVPMTVRVTTLKGADAGVYYVEALPSYYLDPGEPPGVWRGRGAGLLGLSGEVEEDAFLALMARLHPETGERLGRRYGEESVRGYDITASAPKSVSVLFAIGDEPVRQALVDAHDRAVAAMVDWVERHAHTRYRINGEVAVVDAEGIVAACFRQHTSRALDPQLHTHVVIPNRVRSPDGRWLALDARTIKLDQRTLSAIYHAGLRAELTRSLGVAWHKPVNGIAEIAHAPKELLVEFSTRTDEVRDRVDDKLNRFRDRFDRDPTPRERWRLEREAVAESRPPKTQGHDAWSLHLHWIGQARTIGHDPARAVTRAVGRQRRHRQLDLAVGQAVVTAALESLSERQSTWRPAELVRELAAAVPTDVDLPPERLLPWLDRVADWVITERLVDLSPPIPDGVSRRRDGRPVTESVVDRVLTTAEILAEEERIVAWAQYETHPGQRRDRPVPAAGALTLPQRRAAAAVAGDRDLVLIVGPAGTGKTTALAPAVEQLRAEGRAVFGVAPSAAAAEVLAVDVGVDADTLDKLLVEHRLQRPPDHRYDLPAGATVIVDEAAMVATPRLAELTALAGRRRWRLALVGDPRQFSAVGRSGMFGYLADTLGAIELDRVQRFANPWERDASLRLRHGDQSVLEIYDDHGRLHGGTRRAMHTGIVDAWWKARQDGHTTALLTSTNEAARALNLAAQQRRADAGEIDCDRPTAAGRDYQLHVGDVVATRHNERNLRTDRGFMVKNRDHWHITAISRGGAVTISRRTGTVRLPALYVRQHVELAYAETGHASQGRTLDRAFLLVDGPTDIRGVYVPMTRGRLSNDAYVVLDTNQTARDVLGHALSCSWIDQPALARRDQVQPARAKEIRVDQPTMPALLEAGELRQLIERDLAISSSLSGSNVELRRRNPGLAYANDRHDQLERHIAEQQQRLDRAHRQLAEHTSPQQGRPNRSGIAAAHQTIQAASVAIELARANLAEHDARRDSLVRDDHDRTALHERTVLESERRSVRRPLDHDRQARAAHIAANPPTHITACLGERPDDGSATALWDEAAGRIEQHRTAFQVTDTRVPLGRRPGFAAGAVAISHLMAAEACQRFDRALG
jgi:conjugative relaxase-like TrwC/TraI family protein